MLRVIPSSDRTALDALLAGRSNRLAEAERTVRPILESVRRRGDQAVLELAFQLDGLVSDSARVPEQQLIESKERLSAEFVSAARVAAERIRAYAERQLPAEWHFEDEHGSQLGQLVRPLDAVGAYIPGGRYPLPSTLLMTAVPAQTAGVRRIAVATPRPSAVILGTAAWLGIDEVYAVGGAQAVAAFAYGTKSIPKVDRIVGPGNAYVAAAKRLLAGEAGIDFVAGPTEIALVLDEGDSRAIAADMLAQAEHDVDAAAILLTPSRALADRVAAEVARQVRSLPTKDVAAAAIRRNSAAVVTSSLAEACAISNRFAPEHVAVSPSVPLTEIRSAGSVFVGPWSPEAAGDYATGPNHVLPTCGAARLRGGLSVLDYVKIISVQRLSERGLRRLAPAITTLARAEGLEAHARSIEIRTQPEGAANHG